MLRVYAWLTMIAASSTAVIAYSTGISPLGSVLLAAGTTNVAMLLLAVGLNLVDARRVGRAQPTWPPYPSSIGALRTIANPQLSTQARHGTAGLDDPVPTRHC